MAKWLLITAWSVTLVLVVMVLRLDGPYVQTIKNHMTVIAFRPTSLIRYNKTLYFDQDLVKMSELYPVCYNLERTEAAYVSKLSSSSTNLAYYQGLMDGGKLNCGKVRRSKPLFRSKTKQYATLYLYCIY